MIDAFCFNIKMLQVSHLLKCLCVIPNLKEKKNLVYYAHFVVLVIAAVCTPMVRKESAELMALGTQDTIYRQSLHLSHLKLWINRNQCCSPVPTNLNS